MRIHELLESCLEYIAVEGVLGCEPRSLLIHLHTLDPSIDDVYFNYIYTLLLTHPTILPIITAYPIPSVHNPVEPLLGTVPLPDDYVPPAFTRDDIDYTQYYNQGMRGTALSYELSGQPAKKGKDIIKEKRKAKMELNELERNKAKKLARKNARAKRRGVVIGDDAGPSGTSGTEQQAGGVAQQDQALLKIIGEDDGDVQGGAVKTSDLKAMVDKWGSRLRLRCTDDEIYYRLTGSYQKNPKITPIIFHVLQLSARSREKGITAVELGPAVGTSQGSIHYYMKVICSLGLCAKIPAVLYASITSTLIFHRFLNDNENYRAIMNKGQKEEIVHSLPVIAEGQADEEAGLGKEPDPANTWGLDFGQISESELMAGYIVKERVLKLLDHPMLKNHLLKNLNVLPLIGWHSTASLRHRRAMLRHIESLCNDGLVEKLEMGASRVKVLRLTKYNPDYVPPVPSTLAEVAIDPPKVLAERPQISLSDFTLPYHYQGDYLTTLTMDYQMHRAIFIAGVNGVTIYDLHMMMNRMFKRMVDHYLTRTEYTFVPPESRNLAIASLMENLGRERRLRAFTIANYRTFMLQQSAKVDDNRYPRDPPQIGRFAELGWKKLYSTKAEYDRWTDIHGVGEAKGGPPQLGTTIGRTRKGPDELAVKIRKYVPRREMPQPYSNAEADAGTNGVTPQLVEEDEELDELDEEMERAAKRMRYENDGQIRGRPRKYIYVVDPQGTVKRNIIEQVFPHPDLQPIYVWIADEGLLVPPPEDYKGLGPVGEMSEERIKKEGVKPSFFSKYPFQPRGKAKPARKVAGSDGDEDDGKVKKGKGKGKAVPKKAKAPVKKGGKKRKKGEDEEDEEVGGTDVEEAGMAEEGTPIRRSKRAKPVSKKVIMTDEIDELDDSGDENEKVDEGDEGGQPITIDEEVDEYVPPGQGPKVLMQQGPHQHDHSTTELSAPSTIIEEVSQAVVPTERDNTTVTERAGDHGFAFTSAGDAETVVPAAGSSINGQENMLPQEPVKKAAKGRAKRADKAIRDSSIASESVGGIATPPINESAALLPSLEHVPLFQTKRLRRKSTSVSNNGSIPATSPLPATPKSTFESHPTLPSVDTSAQSPEIPAPKAARVPKPRRKTPAQPTRPVSATESLPSILDDTRSIQSPIFTLPENEPLEANFYLPGGFTSMKSKIAAKEKKRKGSSAGSAASASPVKSSLAPVVEDDQAQAGTIAEPAAPESSASFVPVVDGDEPGKEVGATAPESPDGVPPRNALGIDVPPVDIPDVVERPTVSSPAKLRSKPIQPFIFPTEVAPIRAANPLKSVRPDLGSIRRTNEIVQALKDFGGVCSDFKLWQEHSEWTRRVAGTDTPFAPVIASSMDRAVYKRILATVINQGRVKETIATFALPTGKWDKQHICYIPDTPQDTVQAYIRGLADSIGGTTGKHKERKTIEVQPFSEVRLPPSAAAAAKSNGLGKSGEEGREAILKEANVISYLYGYKSGKCARLAALHRAIITASKDPYAKSMISTSPRVFSIKLIHEHLTIGEWFSIVHSTEYDPVLEEYLQDAEKRKTQIRHLPPNIKAYASVHAYRVRVMLINLMKLLVSLSLIESLQPVNTPGEGIVECRDTHLGPRILFKPIEAVAGAQYFRLYEFAPIYHVAANKPSLLGILPVMTEGQVDKFWTDLKIASLQPDVTRLPTIGEAVTVRKGQTATLTETVEPGSNAFKALRSRVRWRSEPLLVQAQVLGVNALVDLKTGLRNISNDAELEKEAYDLAIPKSYIHEFITQRENSVQGRRKFRKPPTGVVAPAKEQAAKLREKMVRDEQSLAKKIADRQAERKAEWEGRVRAASERMKIEFSPGLVEFCARQALHSATRRGDLSDAALEEGCRLYLRSLTLESGAEQIRPAAGFRPAWPKKPRKDKKIRPVKDPAMKAIRNRRKWTHEDDELLLDGEAVLRGRWKNRPPTYNKGRQAMVQLFPDVISQTLFNRLKKLLQLPGRKLYHDKLVDAWYEVYEKYVGTDFLQDDNPSSSTELDLRKHVDFFRQKVHKFTLKMDAATGIESRRLNQPDLPEKVELFLEEQAVWEYRQAQSAGWGAFFDTNSAEETRHQTLCGTSLTVDLQVDQGVASTTRSSGVLRGALKVLQGTPAELYNVDVASRILAPWSKMESNAEIRKLETEKAIHPNRIDRTVTGRPFAFTTAYLGAGEPTILSETQKEAEVFPATLTNAGQDGVEWPILGKGGDLASLLHMVSNDEVDFDFDVREFPTVKHCINTYNTRALNDDGFEFEFRVRPSRHAMNIDRVPPEPRSPFSMSPPARWGLHIEESNELRKAVGSIVQAAVDAGDEGINKAELLDATGLTDDLLLPALAMLAEEAEPRIFWAGYDTARLVSATHWVGWTISTRPRVLNELGGLEIVPERPTIARRWIDIWGAIIESEWEKTWRSALAFVVTRPGLSENGLIAKLAVTMDRLGCVEVLQILLDMGYVERKWAKGDDNRVLPPLEATDTGDHHDVVWFVNSKGLWA